MLGGRKEAAGGCGCAGEQSRRLAGRLECLTGRSARVKGRSDSGLLRSDSLRDEPTCLKGTPDRATLTGSSGLRKWRPRSVVRG